MEDRRNERMKERVKKRKASEEKKSASASAILKVIHVRWTKAGVLSSGL